MKDRISLLIKAKNLTAAQFADEIGVQKSSISHILSGRNNASLDFVQKILLRYPEVNMNWILFGKGSMFKEGESAASKFEDRQLTDVIAPDLPSVDLFSVLKTDNSPVFSKDKALSEMPSAATPGLFETLSPNVVSGQILREKDSEPNRIRETAEEGRRILENINGKAIIKIVEFYSDNTYHEYFPG